MSTREAETCKPHVAVALTGLGRILFRDHETESLLRAFAHLAVQAGPPATAGAWLQVHEPPHQLPATDPVSEAAAAAELDLGEGPCLTAWKEGRTAWLHREQQDGSKSWPRWTAAAGTAGVASAVAVPLVAGNDVVGAVALHASLPLAFDAQDAAGLALFGVLAGGLVENFRALVHAKRLGEQLTEALGTRDLIGTAKGILMEREAIDEDAAFRLLRSASQRSNRKLREIANALVRSDGHAARH